MDHNPKELNMPLVSILMLTYNRAAYISHAIQSVLSQTYTHWELIIIDDGSTDNTSQLINSLSDPRIHYIHHTDNQGLFHRRAESLTYARGVYIAVLDSDDVWSKNDKLAKEVMFLEKNSHHAIVGTFARIIDKAGNKVGVNTFGVTDTEIRNRILSRNQFTHSSVLMRKSMMKKTEGYHATLAEDFDLFLQLGMVGKFGNIPEYLTDHRRHGKNINNQGIEMAWAVHDIILKYKNSYPQYYFALLKSCLRICRSLVRYSFGRL